MSCHAYAAGYLVLVVARDGVCLYSPNLSALVGVHPWDLCWETQGRAQLREAFIEACMFRQRQEAVPVSLRINERVFNFEAWLDSTKPLKNSGSASLSTIGETPSTSLHPLTDGCCCALSCASVSSAIARAK